MPNIASLIDHTILKAEATRDDVMRLCDEAIEHGFASVCVNGVFVKAVREKLAGSNVKTCAVAGFPLGAMKPMVKAIEATSLVKDGADEVDFVAHLPTLLAAVGETDIKEKLLKGHQANGKTFKAHLDGYNQMDALTGTGTKRNMVIVTLHVHGVTLGRTLY